MLLLQGLCNRPVVFAWLRVPLALYEHPCEIRPLRAPSVDNDVRFSGRSRRIPFCHPVLPLPIELNIHVPPRQKVLKMKHDSGCYRLLMCLPLRLILVVKRSSRRTTSGNA